MNQVQQLVIQRAKELPDQSLINLIHERLLALGFTAKSEPYSYYVSDIQGFEYHLSIGIKERLISRLFDYKRLNGMFNKHGGWDEETFDLMVPDKEILEDLEECLEQCEWIDTENLY